MLQDKLSSEVVVSLSNLNDNETTTRATSPPNETDAFLGREEKMVQVITQPPLEVAVSLSNLNDNETTTMRTLPPATRTKATLPPDVTV